MEFAETLECAKLRVNVIGRVNVHSVYSFTSGFDGKTRYVIFDSWSARAMWRSRTRLDVKVVYTTEEGWINDD